MRIGIVGGGGFIGLQLYRSIRVDARHAAHVFDLRRPPDVSASDFTALDVTQPSTVRGAFDGLDVVYYKTGAMDPATSFESPFLFQDLNLEGALRVLEECASSGVAQFVYDSTECVFGRKDPVPFLEESRPSPDSVYGATKATCENYLKVVGATSKMEVAILRYPRVIAPTPAASRAAGEPAADPRAGARKARGVKPNVFTAIRDRITGGQEIRITAGGAKRFDVVHLDDVVRWNLWFLEQRASCVLHVTAGFQITVFDVIQGLAGRLLGNPDYPRIVMTPDVSVNDRLLPDSMLLDARRSRVLTGLDVRHARLEDFL